MHSAKLLRDPRTALFFRCLIAAFLLSFFCVYAQDSSSDNSVLRTDRPTISITVRNSAGEVLTTTAGTVKLVHDGVPFGDAGLSHGRAFFGSLPFGDYTLIVEATGYKSTQKDLNLSVAMRYEVDANLQLDSPDTAGAPAKPLLAPKAKEALDKSLKALSANKLSEAEKYVAEAVKLAPSHPDVLYVQGILFLDKQNWVQAQGVLEKASQMDPTNGRAFSALGMALVDQGNYEAAVGPLEKSLQLDTGTGTWETQWALGKAYYHRQQYDQALKTSQLAFTGSNGKAPQIELLVAQSLTAVGKYEDAAQTLRDFLKRYGDRPEAPTARHWLDGLAKNGKIHPN